MGYLDHSTKGIIVIVIIIIIVVVVVEIGTGIAQT